MTAEGNQVMSICMRRAPNDTASRLPLTPGSRALSKLAVLHDLLPSPSRFRRVERHRGFFRLLRRRSNSCNPHRPSPGLGSNLPSESASSMETAALADFRYYTTSLTRGHRNEWRERRSHSPLATRLSPLATRHSPLATRLSSLASRHSPLATRHSLLLWIEGAVGRC